MVFDLMHASLSKQIILV